MPRGVARVCHVTTVTVATVTAALAAAALMLAGAVPAYPQSRPQLGSVVVPFGPGVEDSAFVPGAEEQLLALVNEVRKEYHFPPVMMDNGLRGAARSHSRDMAVNGFLGHGSSQGDSFFTRLSGIVPQGTLVGENVTAASSIVRVHAVFVHSQGHLKNIINPAFRRVGIGVAAAGDLLITTEDFAN
jgi:uncharacterized protein YkwD